MQSFQPDHQAPELRKLDPRARFALELGNMPADLECLGRTAAPLTSEQKDALAALGVELHSEIGTIFSCKLPSRNLIGVLKLDFVESIDCGSPLYPES